MMPPFAKPPPQPKPDPILFNYETITIFHSQVESHKDRGNIATNALHQAGLSPFVVPSTISTIALGRTSTAVEFYYDSSLESQVNRIIDQHKISLFNTNRASTPPPSRRQATLSRVSHLIAKLNPDHKNYTPLYNAITAIYDPNFVRDAKSSGEKLRKARLEKKAADNASMKNSTDNSTPINSSTSSNLQNDQ